MTPALPSLQRGLDWAPHSLTHPWEGPRGVRDARVYRFRRNEKAQRAVTSGSRPRLYCLLAVGFALVGLTSLMGTCASTPSLATPTRPVPDLRGTWTGSWGGTPLTLFILRQEDTPTSGVYVGPWLLLGRQLPGVAGVLTFAVRNEAISVNVRGWLGDSNGRLTLVLDLQTVNGEQITLTHVDEHRMAGGGTSRLSWEPQGPVELIRQAAEGPGGVRP